MHEEEEEEEEEDSLNEPGSPMMMDLKKYVQAMSALLPIARMKNEERIEGDEEEEHLQSMNHLLEIDTSQKRRSYLSQFVRISVCKEQRTVLHLRQDQENKDLD